MKMHNTTNITFEQVLENRRKWIDFLKEPKRRKTIGELDGGMGRRCCLGHACHVLGAEKYSKGGTGFGYRMETPELYVAPNGIVRMLGLTDSLGSSVGGIPVPDSEFTADSLAQWNDGVTGEDSTDVIIKDAKPAEIAAYLETVINGGVNTPFLNKNEYERTYPL